jgi:hypothetical protein
MRILLTMVHFFRAEESPEHSSEDGAKRDERAAVVRAAIDSWRGHLGPASENNYHFRRFDPVLSMADGLDIAVIVCGDDHLLDHEFCAARDVKIINEKIENPRLLGFAAHRYLAEHRNDYDMFIYTEDDLRILDGALLTRILGFQEKFGYLRLLQPNRFEWNRHGPTLKTYIDGYIPPFWTQHHFETLPDAEFLRYPVPGRTVVCRRAVNPHAGFFALTAEQLEYWIGKPHFADLDCSFVSPLESSATLGLIKTFSVYKPFGRDAGYLEIEHLDPRYSGQQF